MSESSIGSTPSRFAVGPVPGGAPASARSPAASGVFANGAVCARLRCGRVLVEVGAGARGVDDEHALRSRAVFSISFIGPASLADAACGRLAPVVVPHVADDDRRLLRVPWHGPSTTEGFPSVFAPRAEVSLNGASSASVESGRIARRSAGTRSGNGRIIGWSWTRIDVDVCTSDRAMIAGKWSGDKGGIHLPDEERH